MTGVRTQVKRVGAIIIFLVSSKEKIFRCIRKSVSKFVVFAVGGRIDRAMLGEDNSEPILDPELPALTKQMRAEILPRSSPVGGWNETSAASQSTAVSIARFRRVARGKGSDSASR